MKIHKSFSIALLSALLSTGCVAVPERPNAEVEAYAGVFSDGDLEDTVDVNWWLQFDDPTLNAIISEVLQSNKLLKVEMISVRLAEAIARRQGLERSYSTSVGASGELGRSSSNGQDVELSINGGIGASWEIDIFDRIAAQIEAAKFDIEAAREARRDIAIIVTSAAALNYIEIRGAQRRLEVARQNAQTQAHGLELLRTLFENGRATRLDLERAEALYRTTLASQPRFEASARSGMSALAALMGQSAHKPNELLSGLIETPDDIPEHKGKLAAGSVEGLIRRRPDIRAAEAVIGRQLALSEAERADLFPTVIMNFDVLALFDDSINDIGDLSSFGFGIGPSLQWAGPDLRRVRANIDISDTRAEVALAQYEATVVGALSEVEIALTNYSKELERRSDLEQAVSSARRALELASLRFEEGLDDYLDVLEAQRTVLDAEDRLAESRLQSSSQAIAAYRALGGIDMTETSTWAEP